MQLVHSTQSSITVKVEIDENKLSTYISPENVTSYYQSVVVAVPFDGDVSLGSLNLGERVASNKLSQPSSLSTRNKIIEFSAPLFVRGQKIVTVYIFPVIQNSIYSNVEFSLNFTGTMSNEKSVSYDSPFEKMLSAKVLNYEQAKQFASKENKSFASGTQAVMGPFTGINNWKKIEVNQTGLYKITAAQLDNLGFSIIGSNSSNIQMYNGGGKQLPVPNEIARPTMQEIAIKVVDGGDGTFDSGDYILFFGEALNRWVYDTSQVQFLSHSYTENNVYWLSMNPLKEGLRIESVDASLSGVVGGSVTQTIDRHTRRFHVEQNHTLRRWSDNKTNDYYTWYWSSDKSMSFFVPTVNMISSDTVKINLVGKTIDTTGSSDDIGYIDFYVNGIKGIDKSCGLSGCTYSSTSFIDGSNQIDMSLMFNKSVPPYFDFLELTYNSYNEPKNNQLDIVLGQLSGNTQIDVVNAFTSQPTILDISNTMHPRELVIPANSSTTFSFYDTLSQEKFNRYFLMPEAQSLSPLSITSVEMRDLYQSGSQIDLIVISPEFLQNSLSEYVTYRTTIDRSIQLVTVQEIMDNFAFGLYDPTGIRDFLKFTYENYNSPKPSSVLLVGDGSYDFLNNLSTNMPNYVPPYTHKTDNTASDDNYVYFGDFGILDSDTSYDASEFSFDKGFDMMIARWPVRTPSDVRVITEKIKLYESPENFGDWRNNISLVADDEYGTFDNETFHTTQTENLETYHLPLSFNRNKIYLWEFPFVNGEKPEVNDKIVDAFNDGSLLVNYVGHGNPDVWAHENVFNRSGDLPRLSNSTKLPLVIAASCAIGFYDDPSREGMAEELLAMPSGGAIGVLSATRLVYSSDNALYNRKVFDMLFSNKSLTICEAAYTAKLERQYLGGTPRPIINDRNYLYFGDPCTKLARPQYTINFSTQIDSLVALGQTQVVGTVVDNDGNLISENGVLEINVLDSKRDKTYQLTNVNGQVTNEIDYSTNGPTIFRGAASVIGGQFDFTFVSPLDIGFGGEGAQVSVYASFNSVDASGLIDSISISDSIAVTTDSIGPEIVVSFTNHDNFVSGDYINEGDAMILNLNDETGVNLAGGLGHGITLEIDNQPEKLLNLTSYFSFNTDSYSDGSLEFPLDELSVGVHSFKVKAWDNANNFATVEFDVEIKSTTKLEIVNLLNYPNPMSSSTRFSFSLTQEVNEFVLDIFTLSGKKIKTFARKYLEPTYYDDIVWYGKDVDGDRVATEVYIYKATAYPSDGSEKVESFGKIILVN